VNDPRAHRPSSQPDEQLEFLEVLLEENASIAGDVLQVGTHLWAIHGFIPVDGEVLMAEFDSYDQATIALGRLPERTRRRDEL
jgi:hypothetical protein